MTYYLETNALRKLSSKLEDYYSNSFTSALAILEIIGGLKRDFQIRKRTIENLFKSNLEIDWKLPEKVIAESFPILAFEEERIGDLKKLCKILIKSDSLEDFISKCIHQKVRYDLDYFEYYKNFFSNHFIDSTTKGNARIQELFNLRKERIYKNIKVIYGLDKRPTLEYLQNENSSLNRSITIFAFAKLFALLLHDSNVTELQENEIYNSYNGRVSYFVEAYSFYCVEKMIQGGQPNKNDLNDLYHLVYLRDNNSIQMLTNDKLLLNFNEKLWKNINRIKSTIDGNEND